jgi:RNA polymerase sigma factor (sigma-70 family)
MLSEAAVGGPPQSARADGGELQRFTDEQLLSRFFTAHDEAAFGVLLARHGPLVYAVCRRVLGDGADAEDAFQATFMVFVKKGATLRDPSRVQSWLYGVAQRTARKAKAKAARQSKSERQAREMTSKSEISDMTFDDLRSILDEEIAQLPEKYAMPLVLCYLEGKTNAQAAAHLGWPEGSMSRRLSRARELLKSRLAKRGLALSAALIAAVFARPAIACVPPHLFVSTAYAGSLVSHGVAVREVVSPATAALVDDVLGAMAATTKMIVTGVIAAATIAIVIPIILWELAAMTTPAYAGSLLGGGQASHALFSPAGNGVPVSTVSGGAANASSACAAAAAGACGSSSSPSR